jgi:tetratricopeptide (TPR) repeat protein
MKASRLLSFCAFSLACIGGHVVAQGAAEPIRIGVEAIQPQSSPEKGAYFEEFLQRAIWAGLQGIPNTSIEIIEPDSDAKAFDFTIRGMSYALSPSNWIVQLEMIEVASGASVNSDVFSVDSSRLTQDSGDVVLQVGSWIEDETSIVSRDSDVPAVAVAGFIDATSTGSLKEPFRLIRRIEPLLPNDTVRDDICYGTIAGAIERALQQNLWITTLVRDTNIVCIADPGEALEIGRALDADYVAYGRFDLERDSIEGQVVLLETATGSEIDTPVVDGYPEQIAAFSDEIVQRAAALIDAVLVSKEDARAIMTAVNGDDPASLASQGDQQKLLGNYELAAAFYRNALLQAPNDAYASKMLAETYLAQPQSYSLNDALAALDDAIRTNPDDSSLAMAKADVLTTLGEYDAAVSQLSALEPSSSTERARVSYLLGRVYDLQYKTDEATRQYLNAIESDPAFEAAYLVLIDKYISSREFDKALEVATLARVNEIESAAVRERYADIQTYRAGSYYDAGDKDAGRSALREVMRDGGVEASTVAWWAHEFYFDPEFALELYAELLRDSPDADSIRINLPEPLLASGRFDEAYRLAVELRDSSADRMARGTMRFVAYAAKVFEGEFDAAAGHLAELLEYAETTTDLDEETWEITGTRRFIENSNLPDELKRVSMLALGVVDQTNTTTDVRLEIPRQLEEAALP